MRDRPINPCSRKSPPMKRLSRFFMILVLVALPVLCLAGERGLPRPVVPEGFGVNIHFTDPGPGELARFAEAGYRWVRMDFAWEGIERHSGAMSSRPTSA